MKITVDTEVARKTTPFASIVYAVLQSYSHNGIPIGEYRYVNTSSQKLANDIGICGKEGVKKTLVILREAGYVEVIKRGKHYLYGVKSEARK